MKRIVRTSLPSPSSRGCVDGRRRLYRVDEEGLERLRRELDAFWGPALDALKTAAESGGQP